jgi:hypothetical protein
MNTEKIKDVLTVISSIASILAFLCFIWELIWEKRRWRAFGYLVGFFVVLGIAVCMIWPATALRVSELDYMTGPKMVKPPPPEKVRLIGLLEAAQSELRYSFGNLQTYLQMSSAGATFAKPPFLTKTFAQIERDGAVFSLVSPNMQNPLPHFNAEAQTLMGEYKYMAAQFPHDGHRQVRIIGRMLYDNYEELAYTDMELSFQAGKIDAQELEHRGALMKDFLHWIGNKWPLKSRPILIALPDAGPEADFATPAFCLGQQIAADMGLWTPDATSAPGTHSDTIAENQSRLAFLGIPLNYSQLLGPSVKKERNTHLSAEHQ